MPNAIIENTIVHAAMIGEAPIFSIFFTEKSNPNENKRKITPISAHVFISDASIMLIKYGMCGETKNPATMYPKTRGCLSFLNNKVMKPATTRIRARSFTSTGSSDISSVISV